MIRESAVQMNVLVQDDGVGNVFQRQVASFVPGLDKVEFGPNGQISDRLPLDGITGMA